MNTAAQVSGSGPTLPKPPQPSTHTPEDLNYLGGDAQVPSLADSIIDLNSDYRQALLRKGMAFRVVVQTQYIQNMLDAPVPADQQVYVGQRPFESAMVQPIFTADLQQLHLRKAQLYMGGVWNWVSWNPNGPKTLQLWDLYFYKAFGENRIQMKAGYISMNLDFIGLFVGGSTATGAPGVYAVLPYEAGMSYFPLTTPAFTLRIRGPKNSYLKSAAQRSLDPAGGPTEVERNHTGFRFIPHGDKLLLINEGGYLRDARPDAHEMWFRAGYMYNMTKYVSAISGHKESGNYCGYALMDYQLQRSSQEHPSHGLYAGASFMTAPESLDPYSRYYEARLYKEAPFRIRPDDIVSLVASRTSYSKYFADALAAQGKSVWRASTTLTSTYAMRASPGNYFSLGLSYDYGPAISPRVPNALNIVASWTGYF
jgi:porin